MVTEGYRWTQALLFFRTGLSTERVKYKVKIIEYLPQRTKRARSNYKRSFLWFSFFTLWECSIYIRSIFLVGPKYIQKNRICNLVWRRVQWFWSRLFGMNTEDAPGLGEENIIYLAAYVEVKISNPELSINNACISHVQKRFKLLWIWWYR